MKSNTPGTELAKRRNRAPVFAAIGGLVLLAALLAVLRTGRKGGKEKRDEPVWTVESGPLTISISESGRLKNKDEIILKNETERSLKILSIVEEGTMVKKDDLILELDSATLETERDSNELNVKRLESDLIAAEENREILKNQMQSNIDKAELDLKFAKLDLERFIEGVHPQNLETADSQIALAQESLERAETDYSWSKKLHEKGFVTLQELKADELALKQKRSDLKIKESDRALLLKYTHPQEVETVKANVKQAGMALERAQRTARAQLSGQQAKLLSVQAELKSARKELGKAEERLVACKIHAPADGMVVYGTSGGSRHDSRERMEVGATTHPMHRLIRMPMSEVMLAVISVQEATKPKLRDNMEADVTIDALPGQSFSGTLTKIGILPDSTQAWLNPDLKVYSCEIELDAQDKKMRPGMNCHVEIVVEEYENAMFVPIQCVIQVDGSPTVFLRKDSAIERRVIETGMDNNVMVHVLSGLKDGDQVLLAPPLETGIKNGKKANGSPGEEEEASSGKRRESRQADRK